MKNNLNRKLKIYNILIALCFTILGIILVGAIILISYGLGI